MAIACFGVAITGFASVGEAEDPVRRVQPNPIANHGREVGVVGMSDTRSIL